MFNVGGGEVIVILLLALIVLGPDKLPNAAKQAGKYLGEFRRMSQGFQDEIKQAMDLEGLTSTTPRRMEPTRNTSSPANATAPVLDPDAPVVADVPVVTDAVDVAAAPVEIVDATDAASDADVPPGYTSTPDIIVEGPSGSFS